MKPTGTIFIALLCVTSVACDSIDRSPKVSLDITSLPGTAAFDVRANVRGPADGLQYRFTTDDGVCDPQDAKTGASRCTLAAGKDTIMIRVDILKDGQSLKHAERRVTVPNVVAVQPPPDVAVPPAAAPEPGAPATQDVGIVITTVPQADQAGGPDTRAEIGGMVTGVGDPRKYKVILYAHTDFWYIQPLLGSSTEISNGGHWRNWTHTGVEYAALLVRSNYVAPPQLYQRPQARGDVLAVHTVEGLGIR